jgi:hypothetical protein
MLPSLRSHCDYVFFVGSALHVMLSNVIDTFTDFGYPL